MDGWRGELAAIREMLTATPSEGWRADYTAIAQSRGHNPKGWREAVRLWAQDYGVYSGGWRGAIAGIAGALGTPQIGGWRGNMRLIREELEATTPEPPTIMFFLDYLPRQQNARYVILEDGIIEADKILMA